MSSAGRATKLPLALYREPGPSRQRGVKARRAGELSLSTPGLDLAAKLRLFHRTLRTAIDRRDALLGMVRSVNATLDPEKVAEVVIDRASAWIPAPVWAIVSVGVAGETTVLAQRNLAADTAGAVCRVARRVMEREEDLVAADLSRDARLGTEVRGAVLALPLVARGRAIGALVAMDRGPSSREPRPPAAMLRGIRALLEPAAAALDNALLLQRAEALSVTDELTGLYNSRYLNQSLRREAKRASRSGRPLSVVFVDLDGFKGVNDTHGHLFGSRALVEAAAVIRGSARETDVVARFGGDEFALVLPDTGNAGGMAVAARIRERIAAYTFLAGEGINYRLTVSIGVATLPDVAPSAETLLQAADMAMYQVKDAGKNGIRSAASPGA